MKKLSFIFLIIFSCPVVIYGQAKEAVQKEKLEQLGTSDLIFRNDSVEINVISASRSSKKIGELPITIYVVTRDQIMINHYYTLIDVLKSLPGVRVSQPGSGELGESFQLRGLTGNLYTMILINGLPVKPGAVTGMPILAQLPIRQAERIEIIYGPAAAVYGADAVSGVINIITREADKGTFALADVSRGEGDFRNADFMVGGKAGKNKNIIQYSLYGGLNGASDMSIRKGYDEVYNPLHYLQERGSKFTFGTEVVEPINITNQFLSSKGITPESFMAQYYEPRYSGTLVKPSIEDLPSESYLLGLQFRYRGLTLSYNNMSRRSHSSLGQSPFMYRYDNPQNFWGDDIRSTTISYNHEWTPRFSTTTNFSNLYYRMDNNSSFGVTFMNYTDKVYRYSAGNDLLFEQLFTVVPVNGLEVMSGVTYQYSGMLPQTNFLDTPFNPKDYHYFSTEVDYTDPVAGKFGLNPLKYHNVSVFSQTYYSINKFRFMGGVRVDAHSKYGTSLSPRIAGLYIFNPRTSFRSSLGFAYKAPPQSMAWQSLAYKTGAALDSLRYLVIPNPDLRPEKYMSLEFGLIKTYRKKVTLNVSFYYNSIRNLILDKYPELSTLNLPLAVSWSPSDTVLMRENEKKAISRLYGLQANIRINDIVKRINMDAEISLTFAKSTTTDPNIFDIAGSFLTDFKLTPNHFGQLKLSMEPAKNFYLQITSIWESSWLRLLIPFKDLYSEIIKDVDGFYSMDIVANYKLGSNFNTFVKINNLFNERYGGPVYSGMSTPLPYNPQSGRAIQFGFTYTLN